MGLRSIIVCGLLGSTLLGGLGWPATEAPDAIVDVVGPCAEATRHWGHTWRRRQLEEGRALRVSILCRADGRASGVTIVYAATSRGPRFVSWRPVATFFGVLPPHDSERVDIFDETGQLMEYAIVDRDTERVEFYTATSRLTGQGKVDTSSGRVERVSLGGERQGILVLPIPPQGDDAG